MSNIILYVYLLLISYILLHVMHSQNARLEKAKKSLEKSLEKKQLAGESSLDVLNDKIEVLNDKIEDKKAELESLNTQINAKKKTYGLLVKEEEV